GESPASAPSSSAQDARNRVPANRAAAAARILRRRALFFVVGGRVEGLMVLRSRTSSARGSKIGDGGAKLQRTAVREGHPDCMPNPDWASNDSSNRVRPRGSQQVMPNCGYHCRLWHRDKWILRTSSTTV